MKENVQDSNNIGDAGCYGLRYCIKRNYKLYAKFCIYTVTHKNDNPKHFVLTSANMHCNVIEHA